MLRKLMKKFTFHQKDGFLLVRDNCKKYCSTFPVANSDVSQKFTTTDKSLQLHTEAANCVLDVVSRIRWGKVDDVLGSLQNDPLCSKLQVSEAMVADLLQRFGDDWKSALGSFRWASLQSGYVHGSDAYTKMVDILGRMKQMAMMWVLVGEMCRRGLITACTMTKVMRRLVAGGRWEDAVKTFDGLKTVGLERDVEIMNILLDTLCKEKMVDVAHEVFLRYKAEVIPNAYTFNILVHGWCLTKRTGEAEKTILEMKNNGIAPSVITYTNMLRAHCEQSNFCKVFKLLDRMEAEGCPPNTITYTSIINAFAQLEEVEAVMDIVDRMKFSGCKPDLFFYNSLIAILGKAGRLEEAHRVFDVEMCCNGVSPALSTYNTMISVLCQHSQGQNAMSILKEIQSSHLKPDLHSYSPLLKLCIRAGNADKLLCDLLNDIVNKHHLLLDSSTYELLVHGLCKSGKCDVAFLLLEEMLSRGIVPRDKVTYELLLVEANRRGLFDTVKWIKDLIRQHNFQIRRSA